MSELSASTVMMVSALTCVLAAITASKLAKVLCSEVGDSHLAEVGAEHEGVVASSPVRISLPPRPAITLFPVVPVSVSLNCEPVRFSKPVSVGARCDRVLCSRHGEVDGYP